MRDPNAIATAPHAHRGTPDTEAPADPWFYVRIAWSRIWLILMVVALALLVGIMQLRRTPPSYTAVAVLKYEARGQQLVDLGERSSLLYQRDEIATAVQLVRSPAVAELVLNAIGDEQRPSAPSQPPAEPSVVDRVRSAWVDFSRNVRQQLVTFRPEVIDPEIAAREDRVRRVLGGLQAVHRPNTKLIEIRYVAGQQLRAARLANEFSLQFIRSLELDRQKTTLSARAFLDEQIKEAKAKLDQAERAVFEYSGQADLKVLDQNLEIMSQTMAELNSQVERLRVEIRTLEAENEAAQDPDVRRILMTQDAFYSQLRQRQTEMAIERSTIAADNEKDFPAVVKLEREIAGLGEQLLAMENQAAAQVAAELQLARTKYEKLNEMLTEQKMAVGEVQERMITYRVLTREVESSQMIFANLLDQYKRLEVVGEAVQGNVTIVSEATIPRVPSAPLASRILLLWLAIGGGAGFGLALLLHLSDRTVKSPKIVEERLGLPTLGVVPSLLRKGTARGIRGNSLLSPQSLEGQREAINYLRTSIQYSSASRAPQVLLVTSSVAEEGKSTVAANLAISWSETKNARVLLIDADLKRPTVHRAFQLSRIPGLADVLAGQMEEDGAIVPSGVAGLDLLPAGNTVPSPITLLDSDAMGELLARLRTQYTMIVIDSAPSHAMADSLVIAKHVDGVCLVVKQGKTAFEILQRTVGKYQMLNAALLGIIYNHPTGRSTDAYSYDFNYKSRPASRDNVATPG